MITLIILLILALVFIVPTLLIGSLGGLATLIIFGDILFAVLVIIRIIKKLFDKGNKK